jgi:hypothetical protein
MKESGPEKNHKFLTEYAPINDALVQIVQFKNFLRLAEKENGLSLKDLRKTISESDLQSLEEFLKKSKKELEKIKPGIVELYNSLIEKIKNPNLSLEELRSIIQKAESLIKVG